MAPVVGFFAGILYICILVYIITLFSRLVKAIEFMADKSAKTADMLEKMLRKIEPLPPEQLP